jgi:antitoxin component of MazEF toxin-antitoxin module
LAIRAHIRKRGGSLYCLIPKQLAGQLGWGVNTVVQVSAEARRLVLLPINVSLADMLAEINDNNLRPEYDTSEPLGQERSVWIAE